MLGLDCTEDWGMKEFLHNGDGENEIFIFCTTYRKTPWVYYQWVIWVESMLTKWV